MMRTLLAALLASLVGGLAYAQPVPDPLAPARNGLVQCFTPDVAIKACRAIGSYAFNADGSIDSTAVVVVNLQPLIVMTVTSPAFVRDEMLCGPLDLAHLEAASFAVEGVPAAESETAAFRAAMRTRMAPMVGEVCSAYTAQGEGFAVAGYHNGSQHDGLSDFMIWIDPSDGYVVRAAH
jgi:hypothetical protein